MKFPRAKRWLLPGGLLLAVVAGFVWWNQRPGPLEQRLARYRAAGLPTTPTELDAWYLPVPAAENAVPALLEAIDSWRPGPITTNLPVTGGWEHYPRRGEPWSVPMLGAAQVELTANAQALAQIYTALERPRSRYPVTLDSRARNSWPPALSMLRISGGAPSLALEARYAAEAEDPDRATRALLAGLRLAQTLEEEPLLDSYQCRIQLNGYALRATEAVLSRIPLTADQLARLQAGFVRAEATNHLGRAIAGECCAILAELHVPARTLASVSMGPPSSLWETALFRFVMGFYDLSGLKQSDLLYSLDRLDEIAAVAPLPRPAAAVRQQQLEAELQKAWTWREWRHPFTLQKSSILTSTLPTELRAVATLRSAQAAMAVERWRLAHAGSLPSSLDALVPRYLSAVPEDPTDGRPLKFHPLSKGYVIYGLGADGVDHGGKERQAGQNMGCDYTFTVAR